MNKIDAMHNIKRAVIQKISAILSAGLVVLILAAAGPDGARAAGAQEPVERLNAVLIETMMNADRLGYRGRFDLLSPVLVEVFNFPRMAQSTVRGEWQDADEAQRRAMVEAFTRLSIAEFASRFDGFSGERFEVGDLVEGRRGLVLVQNTLFKSDGEGIAINYVVGQFADQWRILDIRLGAAISELAVKRSEYTSVLRSTDLNGLVNLIEQKIDTLEQES
ncbi:MAG: ABC transporter substrate-binding protein [Alphaproteobacteria bacterium]|nr:ABC transporter substrate-binding protein [Alphaproteobacteria bacterium]